MTIETCADFSETLYIKFDWGFLLLLYDDYDDDDDEEEEEQSCRWLKLWNMKGEIKYSSGNSGSGTQYKLL